MDNLSSNLDSNLKIGREQQQRPMTFVNDLNNPPAASGQCMSCKNISKTSTVVSSDLFY